MPLAVTDPEVAVTVMVYGPGVVPGLPPLGVAPPPQATVPLTNAISRSKIANCE